MLIKNWLLKNLLNCVENKVENNSILSCTRCPLHKMLPEGCLPVPGKGTKSSIFIVGEAPGSNEVDLGEPFVGAAGKMLSLLLEGAGIERSKVYITNVVKCRPTDDGRKNRPPSEKEIETCKRHLWEEIKEQAPSVIFTLGKVPTYTLLNSRLKKSFKMSDVIGKKYRVDWGIVLTIIPNLHPSYIMQYGKDKIKLATDIFKMKGPYYD